MMMLAPSTVRYRRDLLGRVIAAGDADNPVLHGSWSYRSDGGLAAETLGAGRVVRTFVYDSLDRLIGITEPAQELRWSYRREGVGSAPFADGGISAETASPKPAEFPPGASLPPPAMVAYAYDPFGRLTGASSQQRPSLDQVAAFDANGNVLSLSLGPATQDLAYTAGTNRLASATPAGGSARTFLHDAAGRVTRAGATSLVRDPVTGRVRRTGNGSDVGSILVGPRGKALQVSGGGSLRRLQIRDLAGQPLVELQAGGSPVEIHVHGAIGRVALWLEGALHAISRDLRGSTRIVYDGQGKVTAWFAYRAFGTLDEGGTSAGPVAAKIRWRYTGQEWDEALALYDYGARLYDPTIGQFLSPDPEDETASPYAYAGGDPIDYVDPDGRMKKFFPFKKGKSFDAAKTPKVTRIYKFRNSYIFLNSEDEIAGIALNPKNVAAAIDDLTRQYHAWNAQFGGSPDFKMGNPLRMKSFGNYSGKDPSESIALVLAFQGAPEVSPEILLSFGHGRYYTGPTGKDLIGTYKSNRKMSVGGLSNVNNPSSPSPKRFVPSGPTLEQRAKRVLKDTKGSIGVSPDYLGPPHANQTLFSSFVWRRSSVDGEFYVLAPPKKGKRTLLSDTSDTL